MTPPNRALAFIIQTARSAPSLWSDERSQTAYSSLRVQPLVSNHIRSTPMSIPEITPPITIRTSKRIEVGGTLRIPRLLTIPSTNRTYGVSPKIRIKTVTKPPRDAPIPHDITRFRPAPRPAIASVIIEARPRRRSPQTIYAPTELICAKPRLTQTTLIVTTTVTTRKSGLGFIVEQFGFVFILHSQLSSLGFCHTTAPKLAIVSLVYHLILVS